MRQYSWKVVNNQFIPRKIMTARAFQIRFSFCYALMMLGSGAQLPFLPLWLTAKNLDVSQIASIVAGMMAVRVLGAPLFSYIADHSGRRIRVIRICAILSAMAYLVLPFCDGYLAILIAAWCAGFLLAPVFPLTEGYSVDASAAFGLDYGRIRLWASMSFLVGSVVSGALLSFLPHSSTIWLIAGAQCMSVFATFMLPSEPKDRMPDHGTKPDFVSALKLLFASRFTIFLIAASLSNASHAMMYSFSSVHWTVLGYGTMIIGFLWATAVLAEVALLAFSNKVIDYFGPQMLLCVGLAGGIVRWSAMAYFTNVYVMFALQLLHAGSFACGHLALMHFIRRTVPTALRNTAQGLYAAIAGGIFLSSATWLSGRLYHIYGGHAYLGMTMMCVFGLLCAVLFVKLNPKVLLAAAT
jgi:PPP family 3-phenylpropionic acid transporter